VTSVVPLRVHLYRNGYVLLCSTDYQHGSAHYADKTMQFSNAARATVDPSYTTEEPSELTPEKLLEEEVVGTGQRRTVAWLSQHAGLSGVDFNTVWEKMRMAVIHAVLSAEGTLAQSWLKLEQGGIPPAAKRFMLPKILGVSNIILLCCCMPPRLSPALPGGGRSLTAGVAAAGGFSDGFRLASPSPRAKPAA
jgi:hypothetical protein